MPAHRKVSPRQLELLVEFAEANSDIALGRCSRGPQGHQIATQSWKTLATSLNAVADGVTKTGDQWRRYWVELKAKTKAKGADMRRSATRTGGGPNKLTPLTAIEERILHIVGRVAVEGLPGVQIPFQDWSQYTPSMLRVARNPALADHEDDVMADMGQLPVADSQLPVADPQLILVETQPLQQEINTPVRASITRVAPAAMNAAGTTRVAAAAMNAAITSRRRPTSRREREVKTARINTLLKCNVHAEEEHAMQIKILQLQEQREKEMYSQEKLKTEQEKIKLEILKIQLQKLKE